MFAHMPGLRVVMPTSPQRAYSLLLAAIRDPDPVIFLEPARIYRAVKQEVADDGQALPLDTCFVLREGRDITLITWGAMVKETFRRRGARGRGGLRRGDRRRDAQAARCRHHPRLDREDRALRDRARGGADRRLRRRDRGAHRGAILLSLQAPIERVTGYDTIMPLPRLEHHYSPSEARILAAARRALAFA